MKETRPSGGPLTFFSPEPWRPDLNFSSQNTRAPRRLFSFHPGNAFHLTALAGERWLWLTEADATVVVKGILEVLRPFASHRGDDWPD